MQATLEIGSDSCKDRRSLVDRSLAPGFPCATQVMSGQLGVLWSNTRLIMQAHIFCEMNSPKGSNSAASRDHETSDAHQSKRRVVSPLSSWSRPPPLQHPLHHILFRAGHLPSPPSSSTSTRDTPLLSLCTIGTFSPCSFDPTFERPPFSTADQLHRCSHLQVLPRPS
jgi:hypothetical protein